MRSPTVIPPSIIALPERAAELSALLVKWADQNSGSTHIAGLAAMRELLRVEFAALPGAIVEDVPLTGTLAQALRVRVRPGASRQLLLNGHYDTVYGADHPFQRCAHWDADTLGGPGVADMKGGLVVMLAACQVFEQTSEASQLGYEILLGPDEEIGSPHSAAELRATAARHRFGLVFEPARPDGSLVRTRMGTGTLRVVCRGRAAHAARAAEGRNAIVALAEFLVEAHALPRELPGVLLNIGQVRGGGAATNIVPAYAEADLDIRVASPESEAAVHARLAALVQRVNACDGLNMELVAGLSRPPKGTGEAESVAFAAWQAAARDLGLPPPDWVDSPGGSDGNILYGAGLPNLDGLGPVGDGLHSDRERIHLPSLVTRAQVAAWWMHRCATGAVVRP